MSDIFILSAVRSAIGDFGGALQSLSPTELEPSSQGKPLQDQPLPQNRSKHLSLAMSFIQNPKTCTCRGWLPFQPACR